MIAEIVLNGFLLSKGSALGIVGGILEAFIFAVLNVGVALIFATFLVPLVNHRSIFVKMVGIVFVLAFLGWTFGLNLSLAHYREVTGTLISGADGEILWRIRPIRSV